MPLLSFPLGRLYMTTGSSPCTTGSTRLSRSSASASSTRSDPRPHGPEHQGSLLHSLITTSHHYPPWQDVSATWSLRRPALYRAGQRHQHLNKPLFFCVMLHSCCSSLLLFFIPWAATRGAVRSDGKDAADHQTFALLVQTGVLLVVTAEVSRKTSCRFRF